MGSGSKHLCVFSLEERNKLRQRGIQYMDCYIMLLFFIGWNLAGRTLYEVGRQSLSHKRTACCLPMSLLCTVVLLCCSLDGWWMRAYDGRWSLVVEFGEARPASEDWWVDGEATRQDQAAWLWYAELERGVRISSKQNLAGPILILFKSLVDLERRKIMVGGTHVVWLWRRCCSRGGLDVPGVHTAWRRRTQH